MDDCILNFDLLTTRADFCYKMVRTKSYIRQFHLVAMLSLGQCSFNMKIVLFNDWERTRENNEIFGRIYENDFLKVGNKNNI